MFLICILVVTRTSSLALGLLAALPDHILNRRVVVVDSALDDIRPYCCNKRACVESKLAQFTSSPLVVFLTSLAHYKHIFSVVLRNELSKILRLSLSLSLSAAVTAASTSSPTYTHKRRRKEGTVKNIFPYANAIMCTLHAKAWLTLINIFIILFYLFETQWINWFSIVNEIV